MNLLPGTWAYIKICEYQGCAVPLQVLQGPAGNQNNPPSYDTATTRTALLASTIHVSLDLAMQAMLFDAVVLRSAARQLPSPLLVDAAQPYNLE